MGILHLGLFEGNLWNLEDEKGSGFMVNRNEVVQIRCLMFGLFGDVYFCCEWDQ